jgi:hypothetical protein
MPLIRSLQSLVAEFLSDENVVANYVSCFWAGEEVIVLPVNELLK